MSRVLPSLWILGAVAYTLATLILAQAFYGGGSGSRPDVATETTRAKDTVRVDEGPAVVLPGAIPLESNMPKLPPPTAELAKNATQHSSLPEIQREDQNELVKVAANAAVVRSKPANSAPMLFAYPMGRPLRVIERQSGFARVEDLGSGQLGWIEEAALALHTGSEREVADDARSRQSKYGAVPRRSKEGLAENELWDAPPIMKEKAEQPRRYSKKRRGVAGILRRAFGRL